MSGLGKSKSCFITLVERKSRFYKAIKSPNRHADVVARLIIDYIKQYPSELVKTITTDNGKEFVNQKVKFYFENNNIDFIQSSPNHPQTNGVIEVAHKNLQKAINKEFLIKKEKFDLEQCIIETLEYYNYHKIHSTTGYTPFDLKDTILILSIM